jgi:hypothetical protein
MTSLAGRLTRRLSLLAAALVCLLFTASEDISIAGIQGSGYAYRMTAYGHITQFGSIFVNGVEYDISGAQIRINGQPAAESALRIGQVVTVNADVDADATEGAAREVSVSSAVVGPLAEVNLSAGTLVVLGQRIRLLPDTFVDQTLNLGGILGLVPGVAVQVSGFPNASGDIVATRVDLALGGASPRITGTVQALNAGKRTFKINSQTVDYGAVALPEGFANGATVSVEGYIPLMQSVLRATSLDIVNGVGGAADELGQVEGVITTFNTAAQFMMGSQRILTNGDTVFDLNGQTLGPDLAVVVRGTYNNAGVLVAHEVKATSTGLVGVLGMVESVTGDTLRVLGVDFATSNITAFDDQSNQNVRVRGTLSGQTLVATEITGE